MVRSSQTTRVFASRTQQSTILCKSGSQLELLANEVWSLFQWFGQQSTIINWSSNWSSGAVRPQESLPTDSTNNNQLLDWLSLAVRPQDSLLKDSTINNPWQIQKTTRISLRCSMFILPMVQKWMWSCNQQKSTVRLIVRSSQTTRVFAFRTQQTAIARKDSNQLLNWWFCAVRPQGSLPLKFNKQQSFKIMIAISDHSPVQFACSVNG